MALINLTTGELSAWVGSIIWPFIRIGSMLLSAPMFGANTVPVTVRLGLSLVLAWAIHPYIPAPPPIDAVSVEGALITAYQILIGVAMGLIVQTLFSTLVIAGQAVALSTGLGFATLVDPQNGVQVPVVSQYYVIIGTLLFLNFNGHLLLVDMLVRSFHWLPVGLIGLDRSSLWAIATWGSHMFALGLLIALPAVAALLLVNLAFGVITRAAPQLNIFAVGFPMTIFLGFVLIGLSLPSLLPKFSHLMGQTFLLMSRVLGG
ncbi:flagellar biosynthetic protein FliR [Acidihalobacter aeolianus]|uniref:Flagellar biosynthetic protein FliR n=1 Tax=Acidihalobacter aeolianus TaxID=2792603 RepID=A0A1D8K6Q9_9GAMM|nr:flagellar biosynthetic protein FliR [Acidihalobacter aeolianus]AOV16641.1 flagellar biosynthetic protein FliR [Acidihalobacter aeolianus]